MSFYTKSPSTPLHVKMIYFLGPVFALFLSLQIEFSRMNQAFEESVNQAIFQIESKVNTFEVALEGFANFLAVSGNINDDEIRAYVQGIRKLYPDLYMFEIASQVAHSDRNSFENSMQAKGYRTFEIHGFDYDDTRQITSISENPFYYPVRFIEPESPDAMNVLGLDLGTTSNVLIETMIQSLKSPRPLASRPFELLEGGKGYVIYRPAVNSPPTDISDKKLENLNFAMLAIRGNDLLPHWLQSQSGYRITLTVKTITSEEVAEVLIEPLNDSQFSTSIHTYAKSVDINNESQPFELTVEKHVNWDDFNMLRMLGVIISGVLVSFYSANRLAKAHRIKLLASNERDKLYSQANFDPLTRLPNINLLIDRAEQAIHVAERSGGIVAICYLDIDKFKAVNDTWGHKAGDELLVEIASRMKQALRAEDTVARIHGDEFVILLPDVANISGLDHVSNKLLSILHPPFNIAGQELNIKSSIGVSSFPKDGRNLEVLLSVSDKRMYIHKQVRQAISQ